MYNELSGILISCNEIIRMEESYQELLRLEKQLDWSRMGDNYVPVADRGRKLQKLGAVKLLKVDERSKIVKSKDVVLILLSDMVIYAKPIRLRKPPHVRYEVYQQFPRSHFLLSRKEDLNDKKEGQNLLQADVYLDDGGEPDCLIFHVDSLDQREAWMTTYEDRGTVEDTDYGLWECPEVEVIHDYEARLPDELSIRVGQRYKVQTNRDGWTQGYNAAYAYNAVLNPSGWFPTSYVARVENAHAQGKALALKQQSVVTSPNWVEEDQTSVA